MLWIWDVLKLIAYYLFYLFIWLSENSSDDEEVVEETEA